ncbi:MAG: 4-hydroxy-tetrahydrodipicolinate reductase [Thermoleophilia bacterium]|jgi:4-hydroxy-tetrahydrodipicolinate reductase
MKIGLMGFGRTGRSVARVLLESKEVNLQWVMRRSSILQHRSVPEFLGVESDELGFIYRIDEFTADELLTRHPVDFVIDFSSESGLDYYGEAAVKHGTGIVTAVSQYPPEQIDALRALAAHIPVMHSPNITVGINFLIVAAKILKRIAPYTDIEIIEEHFKLKQDVSGTAKLIANTLDLSNESIKTIRAGGIIGVHEILFGFPFQTVRLRHESISREAFGNGALFAAKNLVGKPAGLYRMEDLLIPYFHLEETGGRIDEVITKLWRAR